KASRSGRIAVIATESTIRGRAYHRAITAIRPDAQVDGHACSLFVSLAEEGWHTGEIAEAVAMRYLDPIFNDAHAPDTLVLGCTHFPLLKQAIGNVINPEAAIVDSAGTTAQAVHGWCTTSAWAQPKATGASAS
ncbi:glutamate racemase, partial [Salidesulfovibrio brasiliensis]|uniref:glutamate racemase n=1 Tax=Salidesulfovibrio brasiliensis TaxID=221711 RepID=UPI000A5C60D3